MGSISARRLTLGIIAMAMIPAGLSARYLGGGLAADLSGGVLYAALFYVFFALILVRRSPWIPASLAMLWCFGIEFLQLTGLPALLVSMLPAAHLVFGSGFAALDLPAYTLGILLSAALDFWLGQHFRSAAKTR